MATWNQLVVSDLNLYEAGNCKMINTLGLCLTWQFGALSLDEGDLSKHFLI